MSANCTQVAGPEPGVWQEVLPVQQRDHGPPLSADERRPAAPCPPHRRGDLQLQVVQPAQILQRDHGRLRQDCPGRLVVGTRGIDVPMLSRQVVNSQVGEDVSPCAEGKTGRNTTGTGTLYLILKTQLEQQKKFLDIYQTICFVLLISYTTFLRKNFYHPDLGPKIQGGLVRIL